MRIGIARQMGMALLLVGCAQPDPAEAPTHENRALVTAESFVDAFYAWDPDALAASMHEPQAASQALYYQAWAEAAHYQIQTRRPCVARNPAQVECRITVTDDFGGALGYVATDTFTFGTADGKLVGVAFEGDDPPVFEALFDWIAATRPDILSGPCLNMFDGGKTPAECARAVADAAVDFVASGAAPPADTD